MGITKQVADLRMLLASLCVGSAMQQCSSAAVLQAHKHVHRVLGVYLRVLSPLPALQLQVQAHTEAGRLESCQLEQSSS